MLCSCAAVQLQESSDVRSTLVTAQGPSGAQPLWPRSRSLCRFSRLARETLKIGQAAARPGRSHVRTQQKRWCTPTCAPRSRSTVHSREDAWSIMNELLRCHLAASEEGTTNARQNTIRNQQQMLLDCLGGNLKCVRRLDMRKLRPW